MEGERVGAGAVYKIQVDWVEAGMGGPDLIAIEMGTCYKDGIAAWEKIKADAVKEADYDKCAAMLKTAADTTNAGEFCYDSTKEDIKGADTAANFVNTWFIKDFFLKGAKATVAAAGAKDSWATYMVADTVKAREEAFAAEMAKAAKAEADFHCIEGAKNIAASAA